MRLAEHLNGASRLMPSNECLVRWKHGMLRPGIVGMRGPWSVDYGTHDREHTHPLRMQKKKKLDHFWFEPDICGTACIG